jgi:hypothetical protein
MSSWTLITATGRTTIMGSSWTDPVPNLTIRLDFGLGVRINLPSRENDAARLLTDLIEQADGLLATIPGHERPYRKTINRQ